MEMLERSGQACQTQKPSTGFRKGLACFPPGSISDIFCYNVTSGDAE